MYSFGVMPRALRIFASLTYGLLVAHGWYRNLTLSRPRRPLLLLEPEKTPVVIMARSRAEAENLAQLVEDEHIVVGYVQKTGYELQN